ncbi:hypothetical protein CYMTET_12443 [Cymbomonas tetramitiformis]|uniref:PKD/REJ-like domain-containing protein n=1 Tax=Cymbomonas tetramitiformis TaxID=36881 RepID=A0AAE0GKF0_9CHLO|nr:hypothetical protein CYMTET_12443 [Cymbomonas tetramitiformis]
MLAYACVTLTCDADVCHRRGTLACLPGFAPGATFHVYNEFQFLDMGCTIPTTTTPTTALPSASPTTRSPTTMVPTKGLSPSNFQAFGCGANTQGVFGLGSGADASYAAAQSIMAGLVVVKVASGHDHALYLTRGGEVYAAGGNAYGQLGLGSSANQSAAVVVRFSGAEDGVGASFIAAGRFFSLFLLSDGTCMSAGYNHVGQLGNGRTWGVDPSLSPTACMYGYEVADISAGLEHSLFLTTDKRAFAAGSNMFGQLGNGEVTTQPNSLATEISVLLSAPPPPPSPPPPPNPPSPRLHLSPPPHCPGRLHLHHRRPSLSPAPPSSPPPPTPTAAHVRPSALPSTIAATTSKPAAAPFPPSPPPAPCPPPPYSPPPPGFASSPSPPWYWFSPPPQPPPPQFSTPSPPPSTALPTAQPATLAPVTRSPASAASTSPTSRSNLTFSPTSTPTVAPTSREYPVQISAGGRHSMVLMSDGSVYTFGDNANWQLGDLSTINRPTITPVVPDLTIAKVFAGYAHSFFLTQGGSLYAVGDNSWGQLSTGQRGNLTRPAAVMHNVSDVSTGEAHSAFLVTTAAGRSMYASGKNDQGQLCDGTTIQRLSAVRSASSVTVGTVAVSGGGDTPFTLIQSNEMTQAPTTETPTTGMPTTAPTLGPTVTFTASPTESSSLPTAPPTNATLAPFGHITLAPLAPSETAAPITSAPTNLLTSNPPTSLSLPPMPPSVPSTSPACRGPPCRRQHHECHGGQPDDQSHRIPVHVIAHAITCADTPCFEGVTCVDTPDASQNFNCSRCPGGHAGDGISCTRCELVASITGDNTNSEPVSRAQGLSYYASHAAYAPECTPASAYYATWSLVTDPAGEVVSLNPDSTYSDTYTLTIPAYSLALGNYSVTVQVCDGEGTGSYCGVSSARSLQVASQPLTATIKGADAEIGQENVIQVDGTLSTDPDDPNDEEAPMQYTWGCALDSGGACYLPEYQGGELVDLGTAATTPQFQLAGVQAGERYTLSLAVSKVTEAAGSRSTSTTSYLVVKTGMIPRVIVDPQPNKVSPSSKLTLEAQVESEGVEGTLQQNWECNDTSIDLDNRVDVAASPRTAVTLVLYANALIAGAAYSFTLSATDSNGAGYGQVQVVVNTAPRNGTLTVTPAVGVALDTQFVVTASGWLDEDLPLEYIFQWASGSEVQQLSTDFSPFDEQSVVLPAGADADNNEIVLQVMVRDSYGAVCKAPAETIAVVTWPVVAEDQLTDYSGNKVSEAEVLMSQGDTDGVMQNVKGLSQLLNDPALAARRQRRRRLSQADGAAPSDDTTAELQGQRETMVRLVAQVLNDVPKSATSLQSIVETVPLLVERPEEVSAGSWEESLQIANTVGSQGAEVSDGSSEAVVASLSKLALSASVVNASSAAASNQSAYAALQQATRNLARSQLSQLATEETALAYSSENIRMTVQRDDPSDPSCRLYTEPLSVEVRCFCLPAGPLPQLCRASALRPCPCGRARLCAHGACSALRCAPLAALRDWPYFGVRASMRARRRLPRQRRRHAARAGSGSEGGSMVDPLPAGVFNNSNVSAAVSTSLLAFSFDPHAGAAAEVEGVTQGATLQGGVTELTFEDADARVSVSNLTTPITFVMPINRSFSIEYGEGFGCFFWDEAAAAYLDEGCAAIPNPRPSGSTLAWKANFSLEDPATPYLNMGWEAVGGADGCVEVFEPPPLSGEYRYPLVRRYTVNSTASSCELHANGSLTACYWDADTQTFLGDGCVVITQVDCMCTHATDFGVANQEPIKLKVRVEPPTLNDIWAIRNLVLICLSILFFMFCGSLLLAWENEKARSKLLSKLQNPSCGFQAESPNGTWTWSLTKSKHLLHNLGVEMQTKQDMGMECLNGGTLEILGATFGIPFLRIYLSLPLDEIRSVKSEKFVSAKQHLAGLSWRMTSALMMRPKLPLRDPPSEEASEGPEKWGQTRSPASLKSAWAVHPNPDAAPASRNPEEPGGGSSDDSEVLEVTGQPVAESLIEGIFSAPLPQPRDDAAPFAAEHVNGTAMARPPTSLLGSHLVLAFLCVHRVIPTQLLYQKVAEADALLAGTTGIRGRDFRSMYSLFKVMFDDSLVTAGWYQRSFVWKAMFTQSVDGSWSDYNTYARTFSHILLSDDEHSETYSHPYSFFWDAVAATMPVMLRTLTVSAVAVADGSAPIDKLAVWTTLLIIARLDDLDFMWAEPTADGMGIHTVVDRAVTYLRHVAQRDVRFAAIMPDLEEKAKEQVGVWKATFSQHRGEEMKKLVANIKLRLTLGLRVQALWVGVTRFFFKVLRYHATFQIFMVRPGAPPRRSVQRSAVHAPRAASMRPRTTRWPRPGVDASPGLRSCARRALPEPSGGLRAAARQLHAPGPARRLSHTIRLEAAFDLRPGPSRLWSSDAAAGVSPDPEVPGGAPLTASMRLMVLSVVFYGTLLITIWFFESRSSYCCADFRTSLGCDPNLDAQCRGLEASCAQLYDVYPEEADNFDCRHFPDVRQWSHQLVCILIPTSIMQPIVLTLITLFRMASKAHVEIRWHCVDIFDQIRELLPGSNNRHWRRSTLLGRRSVMDKFYSFYYNPLGVLVQLFSSRLVVNNDDERRRQQTVKFGQAWQRKAAEKSEVVQERRLKAFKLDKEQGVLSERFELAGWMGAIITLAIFTYFIFNYAVALYNNIGEDSQNVYIIKWVQNRVVDIVVRDFNRPISLLAQTWALGVIYKVFLRDTMVLEVLETDADDVSMGLSQTLSVILKDSDFQSEFGLEFANMDFVADDTITGFE